MPRKILVLLYTVILFIIYLPSNGIYTAASTIAPKSEILFELPKIKGNQDDTVSVSLSMEETDLPITDLDIELIFDRNAFSVASYTCASGLFVDETYSGIRLLGDEQSAIQHNLSGIILTLKLKISEHARNGRYPLEIGGYGVSVYDEENGRLYPLSPFCPDGEIVVGPVIVEHIDWFCERRTLQVGETEPIRFILSPSDADDQTLSFSVSNHLVLSVSSDGVVTAISPGNTTITATAAGGAKCSIDFTVIPQTAYRDGNFSYAILNGKVWVTQYHGTGKDVNIPPVLGGKNIYGIWNYAFAGMPEIESVIVPQGVEAIHQGAFQECSGLTEILLPETVKRIERDAFLLCENLRSIRIPSGVTFIGLTAFEGCHMGFTIYGESGSYPQAYAESNNYPFVCVNILPEITSSRFTIENSIISGIPPELNIPDFLAALDVENGCLLIKNKNGDPVTTGYVATGYTISLMTLGGQIHHIFTAAVRGDVHGTGRIASVNLLIIQRHILGINPLLGAELKAADIDMNGRIASVDLLVGQRHILQISKIS